MSGPLPPAGRIHPKNNPKQNIKEKGFRIITNSGKDGNQDVMHFHIHLLGGENLGRMITLNS